MGTDPVLRLAYDYEQDKWTLTLDAGSQRFTFPVQARVPEQGAVLDREHPPIEIDLPPHIGIDFRVIRPLARGWAHD